MPNLLRLDRQLCFWLYSASRAVTAAYAPLLERLGLTYPQYLVLLVLWETDGVSVKALGDKLYLDSGTLTPLLKKLEAQGLVSRTRDETDSRVVRISLTAEGHALEVQAQQVPRELFCHAPFDLTGLARLREELKTFTLSLREANARRVHERDDV